MNEKNTKITDDQIKLGKQFVTNKQEADSLAKQVGKEANIPEITNTETYMDTLKNNFASQNTNNINRILNITNKIVIQLSINTLNFNNSLFDKASTISLPVADGIYINRNRMKRGIKLDIDNFVPDKTWYPEVFEYNFRPYFEIIVPIAFSKNIMKFAATTLPNFQGIIGIIFEKFYQVYKMEKFDLQKKLLLKSVYNTLDLTKQLKAITDEKEKANEIMRYILTYTKKMSFPSKDYNLGATLSADKKSVVVKVPTYDGSTKLVAPQLQNIQLKDLILITTPEIDSFISTKGYASYFNEQYIKSDIKKILLPLYDPSADQSLYIDAHGDKTYYGQLLKDATPGEDNCIYIIDRRALKQLKNFEMSASSSWVFGQITIATIIKSCYIIDMLANGIKLILGPDKWSKLPSPNVIPV